MKTAQELARAILAADRAGEPWPEEVHLAMPNRNDLSGMVHYMPNIDSVREAILTLAREIERFSTDEHEVGRRTLAALDLTIACTDASRDVPAASEQRIVESVIAGLEHWLRQGMFAQADDLLRCYRPDLPVAALLGALSITYPAKDKLKAREAFLTRTEARLRFELGDARAEALLQARR